MEEFKEHKKCRICQGDLKKIYDFDFMPLVNSLGSSAEESFRAQRFEQKLLFCGSCLLGQLSIVVNPEILYKDYVYHSSVSPAFVDHCRNLVEKELDRKAGSVVIDIAGNDGCLAKEVLKNNSLADVFVIDIAQNDDPSEYTKIKKFWNMETAIEFVNQYGRADVIFAQNVVGHVDDIIGFFDAVAYTLKPGGRFIVEIPSLIELIRSSSFETIYHEHVSYWTETAMMKLAKKTGLALMFTEMLPVHLGSFRFSFCIGSNIVEEMAGEREFFSNERIQNFSEEINLRSYNLEKILECDGKIICVTASAKACVLLNIAGITYEIAYAIDDTPEKQKKFIPGTPIEIKPFSEENISTADIAVIMSRNLTAPLFARLKEFGFKGILIAL